MAQNVGDLALLQYGAALAAKPASAVAAYLVIHI